MHTTGPCRAAGSRSPRDLSTPHGHRKAHRQRATRLRHGGSPKWHFRVWVQAEQEALTRLHQKASRSPSAGFCQATWPNTSISATMPAPCHSASEHQAVRLPHALPSPGCSCRCTCPTLHRRPRASRVAQRCTLCCSVMTNTALPSPGQNPSLVSNIVPTKPYRNLFTLGPNTRASGKSRIPSGR